MSFIDDLRARGLVQDISDEAGLSKLPKGTPCYIGFDPSAPSLQLGNLVGMLVLIHLGKAGFKPIMLFGGATGSIGDPSGRSQERQLLEMDATEKNLKAQQAQARAIFERAGVEISFVNNMDWTREVRFLDFLRDVGKHFTVNYMLAKDVVKSRVESAGISYTEFSYMLLQSFDFLHLYQSINCRLQLGGSDQWGNITAGLELIRRKVQGDAYAMSFPLILDSQGRKFGKSEGGALWLNPEMTSPYKLHQYLLNVEDSLAPKYLRIFSFLSEAELAAIEAEMKSSPEKRSAQRALADAVCDLVHGKEATADARRCAEVFFGASLEGISENKLLEIFSEAPSSSISRAEFESFSALDAFEKSGLAKSRGEAKKLIASGGAYLNNERISDAALKLSSAVKNNSKTLVLRSGKKNYHLMRVNN